MNSNVISVPKEYWSTLVLLKDSIRHLKNKDPIRYKTTIDKEQRMFNDILYESCNRH